jgi:hypothetical protein
VVAFDQHHQQQLRAGLASACFSLLPSGTKNPIFQQSQSSTIQNTILLLAVVFLHFLDYLLLQQQKAARASVTLSSSILF